MRLHLTYEQRAALPAEVARVIDERVAVLSDLLGEPCSRIDPEGHQITWGSGDPAPVTWWWGNIGPGGLKILIGPGFSERTFATLIGWCMLQGVGCIAIEAKSERQGWISAATNATR